MMQDAGWGDISYVCENLRPSSRVEAFLTSTPDEDVASLARSLHAMPGFKWVALCDGIPAAIVGAYPMHPGVWGAYGLGTDDYASVIRSVTKCIRRQMLPAVMAVAHRVQCMSPAWHEETHRWLEMLGARNEGVLRGYGRAGQDVAVLAWTRGDV